MKLLFDASALLNSVRRYRESIVEFVEKNECYALSLTQYEIGNALWKEVYLLRRIDVDEAVKVFNFVNALLNLMRTIDLSSYECRTEILGAAMQFGLTFYDATYLAIARDFNCNLVTDDEELVRMSEKLGVKVIKSVDLPCHTTLL